MKHALSALVLALASASAWSYGSVSINIPLESTISSSSSTTVYGSPGSTITMGTQVPRTVCYQSWRNGYPYQDCRTEYVWAPGTIIQEPAQTTIIQSYPYPARVERPYNPYRPLPSYQPYGQPHHHHQHHNNKPYNPYGGNIQFQWNSR